jgi:hypothetical protein
MIGVIVEMVKSPAGTSVPALWLVPAAQSAVMA